MKKEKWSPSKKLWIWTIIVLLIIILLFIMGIIIGYVGLGHGKFSDVFLPYTWYHIFDFWK